MQNRFWYLALIVIGSIVVAVVYWKSRNRHTFTLLFGMSGICYIIETLLHTTLKAYEFFPRFMQDSYDDSLWGGIISDLFVLPPAAVLVGVFQLGWGWIVVISGIISAIEELFLKLGIYEQYWWKTWYTFIGGILLFFFAKWWYRQLNRSHGRKLTFLTVVSILYCLNAKLYIFIQNDLKHGRFFNKWIEAHGVNSTIILAPLSLFIAILLAILIVYRVRWWWRAALIFGLTGLDLLLYFLKVLYPNSYWLFALMFLGRVIILFIGLAFDRLLRNKELYEGKVRI
jgi:hypothetical protein